MTDLESLRPLYEAATAATAEGLTASEELVKAVGRLLDQPEAHPTEEHYVVEYHNDGALPQPWMVCTVKQPDIETARRSREGIRRHRLEVRSPMRIVRVRTTYTVIETEEAGHVAAE